MAAFAPWSGRALPSASAGGLLLVNVKWKVAVVLAVLAASASWVARETLFGEVPLVADEQRTATVEEPAAATNDLAPPAPAASERTAGAISAESIATAPVQVAVLVTDMQKRPIAGARVSTFEDSVAGTVETDASGRAVLPIATAEKATARVTVEADGYDHAIGSQWRQPLVEVQLPRLGTLKGRVLERGTRRPIAGVRIEHPHAMHKGCEPELTTSDADGAYTLERIPFDRSHDEQFKLSAEGFPEQRLHVRLPHTALEFEHDFFLDGGADVVGLVVDFESGAPIDGARVTHLGRELARTTPDGRFRARVAPRRGSDRIELRFVAEGRCALERAWSPDELGEDHPVRVPLPREARLRGIVRDEFGAAVPVHALRIEVDPTASATASDERALGSTWSLREHWTLLPGATGDTFRTDAEGRFETPAIVPHTPSVRLSSWPNTRGRIDARSVAAPGPGEVLDVDLVLRRAARASIAGRLLLNGDPIGGTVSWTSARNRGHANADDAGRFVLEDVDAGEIRLRTSRGRAPASVLESELTIVVEDGARLERDFDLAVPFATISGIVRHADGAATRGVRVWTGEHPYTSDGFDVSTLADETGRFEARVPASRGPYRVRAHWKQDTFVVDDVQPGASGVVIVVEDLASVFVRAIDAETREPLSRFDVYMRADANERYALRSDRTADSSGSMRVPGVRAGTWDVHVRSAQLGYLPVTLEARSIAKEGEVRLEVALERAAKLELVLAPDVAPWPKELAVVLLDAELDERRARVTETFDDADLWSDGIDATRERLVELADRRFAIVRGLAPGRYRLRDAKDTLAFEPEVIEVASGAPTRVVLRTLPR